MSSPDDARHLVAIELDDGFATWIFAIRWSVAISAETEEHAGRISAAASRLSAESCVQYQP